MSHSPFDYIKQSLFAISISFKVVGWVKSIPCSSHWNNVIQRQWFAAKSIFAILLAEIYNVKFEITYPMTPNVCSYCQ